MPPHQPNHTTGLYKSYKVHTDLFICWLTRIAAATGYKDSSSTTAANPRTKDNAKKGTTNQETPKNIFPIRVLLAQAQWITEHFRGTVKVPDDVQFSLQFAILLRRACAEFFEKVRIKTAESNTKEADENHQNFIAVLEQIWNILKLPNNQENTKSNNVSASTPKSPLDNRFTLLSVDDPLLLAPGSLSLPDPPDTAPPKEPVQPASNILRSDHYELEADGVSESSLKIFCLFRDLYDHRGFLKETWETSYDDQSGLMVCSLITNLALDLVDRAERNIMVPNAHGRQLNPYRETYMTSSAKESSGDFSDNCDLGSEDLMRVMPDDQFVYSSAYNSLFTAHIRDVHESLQRRVSGSLPTLRFVKETYDNIQDHANQQNPGTNSGSALIPSNPDWNEEDILLKQMMLDLHFRHPMRYRINSGTVSNLPFRDKLTENLEDAYENVVLNISTIFSAEALLDIHRILGSRVPGAFEELRRRGAMAESAVGIKYKQVEGKLSKSEIITDKRTVLRDWVNDTLLNTASEFCFMVKRVIRDNLFIAMKRKALDCPEAAERQNFPGNRDIHSSPDPGFWFHHQPVYCGMESLKLAVEQEILGLKLVNLSTAFLAAGHLYHTCARLGLIDAAWVAMDVALDIHKDQLFKGEFPLTLESMVKRFKLNIGFKAQDFAKNKRIEQKNGISTPSKKEDHFMKLSEESQHIARYLERKDTAEILIKNLCPQPKNKSGIQEEPRSNVEMLTQLRQRLPAIIKRMDLDLITLNRKSCRLLLQVSERYKSELGIENETRGFKKTDITPRMFVVMVMETLTQASQFWERAQKSGKKVSVKEMYGPRLALAADVVTEMLLELNREEQVEPFPVVSSFAQVDLFRKQ